MAPLLLRLYVTGHTPRSEQALINVRRLVDELDIGPHDLEIIDILEQPERAEEENLLATPTLIKVVPPPIRRVIGDLSNLRAVAEALGLDRSSPPGGEDGNAG
ncbi:MAG: circadian clock protein KaiB [Rhodospirillaceae bacterium]|nr:circadian clock protein KaiB [Rhodospirillaceae bacterium]